MSTYSISFPSLTSIICLVDQNSVRVSGGAGKATILEVAYEQKFINEPASTPSQQKLDRIAEIDAQIFEHNTCLDRIHVSLSTISTILFEIFKIN